MAPIINRVNTNIGPIGGGTHISIEGSNFDPALKVFVGGIQCPTVIVTSPIAPSTTSQSFAEAVSPAHVEGTFDVTVTNPGGLSAVAKNAFRYVDMYVSSVTPSSGPSTGGVNVILAGKGFTYGTAGLVGAPGVNEIIGFGLNFDFSQGGAIRDAVVDSDTQMHGLTPPSFPGIFPVKFMLQIGSGTVSSGPATFTVTEPFLLFANPSPSMGGTAGGTEVSVSGKGIYITGSSMEFDGTPGIGCVIGPPTTLNGSVVTLTCKTPPHASGTVDVTIRNPDNTSTTVSGAFTYN
jgi:hypothetical protein